MLRHIGPSLLRLWLPALSIIQFNARCGKLTDAATLPPERFVSAITAEPVTIADDKGVDVSGLLQTPPRARACYVLAHGAGAGMTHPFLAAVAAELSQRGIATLRYQFPYMERGGKRPDPPAVAHATVRAAVDAARRSLPDLPLIAGGKSFGGRMTSQAQAKAPLPGVSGLAFLGFPLHPAGQPSQDRAEHLFDVKVPMLFLQGTRDTLAELDQLEPLCRALGSRATLKLFQDADHSFHVPARTGRKDADVRGEMLDVLAAWIDDVIKARVKAR
jgi:predicted alpha/beta-hydrolase family hydrolase